MKTAWLEWNGHLFWAQHKRSVFEPRSAVSSLIEGIWRQKPGSAHFILRSRIYTDAPVTELCRGMVIVCAKRITGLSEIPMDVKERMLNSISATRVDVRSVDAFGAVLSHSRARNVRLESELVRAEENRSIECWLVAKEGRLLATAINSAGRNRTNHAEMNLLRWWWHKEARALPAGSRLITTLEPCPMCAGAIWECVESREDFLVEYLHADPGRAVQRSVLRGSKLLRQCVNFGHPL